MNPNLEVGAFAVFLVFCRVGGCVMFAPGLSSARIPMRIRLLVAIAVSLALAPLLFDAVQRSLATIAPPLHLLLVGRELLAGLAIGLTGRFFLLALQFAATLIANVIGLAGIPGVPMEETESGSPLATFASTAAVMVMLGLNLHIEMVGAIVESYGVMPLELALRPEWLMRNSVEALSQTSMLALRLSAPFVAYGIVVNVAIGLANRFAPHVSVYHAATGAVMLGGFLLLYVLAGDWLSAFVLDYQNWLMRGGF